MGFFKSYLKPGKKVAQAAPASNSEKVHTPTIPSGVATPNSARGSESGLGAVKADVLSAWLFQKQAQRAWLSGRENEGVVLKKSVGLWTCFPPDLANQQNGLMNGIEQMNVKAAMTVSTPVIRVILENINQPSVPLADGLRVQVLPSFSYLGTCKKHQSAAFIADSAVMVVWDDDPYLLLERIENLVAQTLKHIWGEGLTTEPKDEKEGVAVNVEELSDIQDLEDQQAEPARPLNLIQSFITAFCLALAIAAIGLGWKKVAEEVNIDGSYIRVALALAVPLQLWAGLFFFQSIGTNLCQLFGPVRQMNVNSKFYSAIPTKRLSIEANGSLPHVTIQCPVYKEGLNAVIEPTVRSIKAAISTYEMQGGTANIFINDDGMQLIPEEEAAARQDFYEENNIGWVARPRHDPKGDHGTPFMRRGKFKKASNMNYALWVSNRVEDKLAAFDRSPQWTQADEAEAYKRCLLNVVHEDEGRTWTDGNIRVGDYILLIDSDTRVPKDCLLDAVSELEASPQVAILQYASGVMNITSSFFEKGITFFTNMVYTQIKYAVANGDVAPFVGHNAILRWAAVQEIAYHCPDDDGREKYWSESTVSEDFDMALRLQAEGYTLRLGGYTGDGFQEGVSLTVYDELARWEKYAYGCSELLFHPLRYWFTRGPFTPLFRRFLRSPIPLASKFTIMAYIGTYYALASAWLLTLANYFLTGWFLLVLDEYYLHSFMIWVSVVVVFSGVGNLALAVMRYRIGQRSFLGAFIENITWVPLLMIFLGGVSIHVSQAILAHLFSVDMSWGATAKEVENTTFFEEVPKIAKKFKWTFVYCFFIAVMMPILAFAAPAFWQIRQFISIFPLAFNIFCHLMLPIALNPSLMLFTW